MRRGRRPLSAVYAVPVLVFAVSLTGLVWALLADSTADRFAALAAGIALAVIAFVLWHRH